MIRQSPRIGRSLQPLATCSALIAAGCLLAGCGLIGSSGGSTTPQAPPPQAQTPAPAARASAPVTRAQARAYTHTVALHPGDVPGMAVEAPAGETPPPNSSVVAFVRCSDGVSLDRRVLKVHSPTFTSGHGRQAETVESAVEVWPTPVLATVNTTAYLGSRGQACFARSLEAAHRRANQQRPGGLQYGPIRVAVVANPMAGVSHSFLRTVAFPLMRGGQVRVYVYHDDFSFVSGSAEVELDATGFSRPVPAATEERLLLLLVGRAKAARL